MQIESNLRKDHVQQIKDELTEIISREKDIDWRDVDTDSEEYKTRLAAWLKAEKLTENSEYTDEGLAKLDKKLLLNCIVDLMETLEFCYPKYSSDSAIAYYGDLLCVAEGQKDIDSHGNIVDFK